MKKQICNQICERIKLGNIIEDLPQTDIEADILFCDYIAKKVKSNDVRATINWEYLINRIKNVVSVNPVHNPERLAYEIARVVLPDTKANEITISIHLLNRKEFSPSIKTTFLRKDLHLDIKTPFYDYMRNIATRIYGGSIKLISYPFHAIFKGKRWEIPAIDKAKKASKAHHEIPLIIWQTNFTSKCSLPLWINYKRNRRLSPEFEHRYVSTEDRAEYIKTHASERVAKAYNKLIDGAAQADLWRLVVLYNEGGIYLDMDGTFIKPLSKIIKNHEVVYLWDKRRYSNYFLATKPHNPILKEFIDIVVANIENAKAISKLYSVFYITGPGATEAALDKRTDITYTSCRSIALQGVFTNEKFQYIDRPRSKWTYKKSFIAED